MVEGRRIEVNASDDRVGGIVTTGEGKEVARVEDGHRGGVWCAHPEAADAAGRRARCVCGDGLSRSDAKRSVKLRNAVASQDVTSGGEE